MYSSASLAETRRPSPATVMAVLADAYDAFLFDLDGVLYRGTEVIRRPEGRRPPARGRQTGGVRHEQRHPDPESVAARLDGVRRSRRRRTKSRALLVMAARLAAAFRCRRW